MNELLPSDSDVLVPEISTELPHIAIDKAWAIDVDRTLSSVRAVILRLASIGEQYGVPGQQFIDTYQDAKNTNRHFDPLKEYRSRLSPAEYAEFCAKFNDPNLAPITYGDTPPFLGRLIGPRVLLTYAQQVPFQRIKLQSIPYEGYAHVLEHTDKGPVIESWRTNKGTFDFLGISKNGEPLAIYKANRVNLVDDNDQSHKNLPPESMGYYLRRLDESGAHPAPDTLPQNVVTVNSLDEITGTSSPHSLSVAPEQPFAYIPLNEAHKPLLRLGHTILTSLTEQELNSRAA